MHLSQRPCQSQIFESGEWRVLVTVTYVQDTSMQNKDKNQDLTHQITFQECMHTETALKVQNVHCQYTYVLSLQYQLQQPQA